jgi:hypothetical protein
MGGRTVDKKGVEGKEAGRKAPIDLNALRGDIKRRYNQALLEQSPGAVPEVTEPKAEAEECRRIDMPISEAPMRTCKCVFNKRLDDRPIMVGKSVDVGGYSATVVGRSKKGAVVDINASDGKVIAKRVKLGSAAATIVSVPADAKEIEVKVHQESAYQAKISLKVHDMLPGKARVQPPKSVTETVTLENGGDGADVYGFTFRYGQVSAQAREIEVTCGATGATVKNIVPKSDKSEVIEVTESSKRITITPKVVYLQSVEAEITVEQVKVAE